MLTFLVLSVVLLTPCCLLSIILLRMAFTFFLFQLTKRKYNHVIHPHAQTTWLPFFFRLHNPNAPIGELMHEAYDPAKQRFYDISYQGFYLGGYHLIGLAHPDDVTYVLKNPLEFAKPETYEKARQFMGSSLVMANGEMWKQHRHVLNPAFQVPVVKRLMPIMVKRTAHLIGQLEQQHQACNPIPFIKDALLKTLVDSLLFESKEYLDQDLLLGSFYRLLGGLPPFFFLRFLLGELDRFIPFDAVRRPAIEKQNMDKLFKEMLARRRRDFKGLDNNEKEQGEGEGEGEEERGNDGEDNQGGQKRCDMVSLMLAANMSDQEICDELTGMLFGAQDTTSNSLSWALYYLAKYPEYQEKIHRQLTEGEFDLATITPEGLDRFPLCKYVFKEALRLRPSHMGNPRLLLKPLTLHDGTVLPEGTVIQLMWLYLHHDPRYWEEPSRFWPERFENLGDKNLTYIYFPFLTGPRNCIGHRFATQMAELILASIISKFEIKGNVDKVQVDTSMLLTPANLRLRFVPRD